MPPKRVASSSRGASASGGSKNKLKRKRETVSPTGPIRPKAKPVDAEPPTVSVRRPTIGKGSTIAAQSDKIGATKRNTDDGSGTKTAGCSLKQYLTEPSWQEALAPEFGQSYFMKIEGLLEKDYNGGKEIFPPKDLIFNAFNLKPLDEVKVVILGQDPYHDDDQAHGLSFSVPPGVKVPPSLKNIYKELAEDIPGFRIPSSGCLLQWAGQGVFLINATLTVEAHTPNSHAKYGWQRFTDRVIEILSQECNGLVFILWGNFAQKKGALIDDTKHTVIKTAHPSPLSVKKFFGCKCFSQTNDALQKNGKEPINWAITV